MEPTRPPCRHFSAKGWCLYGESCRYAHVAATSPAGGSAEDAALAAKAAAEEAAEAAFLACKDRVNTLRRSGAARETLLDALEELRTLQERWHSSRPQRPRSRFATRRKLQNCERAGIFRRFLTQMYGLQNLRDGGVLDVAGGHGFLAFELENVARVPVTVVDPRPLNMVRMERKWRLGGTLLAHEELELDSAPRAGASVEVQRAHAARVAHREVYEARSAHGEAVVRPRHWRHLWEARLWEDVVEAAPGEPPSQDGLTRLGAVASELRAKASRTAWTSKGLEEAACVEEEAWDAPIDAPAEEQRGEDAAVAVELPSPEEMWRRMAGCAMIVGMHPDGATEPIVDFALASGKPFAVVPCCVYATLAPTRRDRRGQRVTQYEHFCEYLVSKAPGRIAMQTLPFEGKNVVVYSLPPCTGTAEDDLCDECSV